MARTIVPVADLRIEPCKLIPEDFSHHNLRDSQLLFNEEIEILEQKDEWVRVAAIEQGGMKGWMHQSEIGEGKIDPQYVIFTRTTEYSYGTYLNTKLRGSRPIPKELNREQLIREAKQFLGAPYLWGGRSSFLYGIIASVDCSGLINLLYRAQGITIPRNAHEQSCFGKRTTNPLPGDPLYLAKEERVSHVVLKLNDDFFLESPESGKRVRLLRWGKDIWEDGGRIHFLDREHSYRGYFVTFSG